MKKLIALATLLFAFTINANAQDKKSAATTEATSKNELITLTSKLKLNEDAQRDFYTLLTMKNEEIANKPTMTAAEKEKMMKKIETKMMGGLDEAQKKTLANDPELRKIFSN